MSENWLYTSFFGTAKAATALPSPRVFFDVKVRNRGRLCPSIGSTLSFFGSAKAATALPRVFFDIKVRDCGTRAQNRLIPQHRNINDAFDYIHVNTCTVQCTLSNSPKEVWRPLDANDCTYGGVAPPPRERLWWCCFEKLSYQEHDVLIFHTSVHSFIPNDNPN